MYIRYSLIPRYLLDINAHILVYLTHIHTLLKNYAVFLYTLQCMHIETVSVNEWSLTFLRACAHLSMIATTSSALATLSKVIKYSS